MASYLLVSVYMRCEWLCIHPLCVYKEKGNVHQFNAISKFSNEIEKFHFYRLFTLKIEKDQQKKRETKTNFFFVAIRIGSRHNLFRAQILVKHIFFFISFYFCIVLVKYPSHAEQKSSRAITILKIANTFRNTQLNCVYKKQKR